MGVVLVALVISQVGCGGAVRNLAREATPGVVEGAAEAVADPVVKERLVESVEPSRVRRATRKVASGTTDGVLDAVEDPVRQKRIVRSVEQVVGASMESAMGGALSEENRAEVRALTRQLVADSIKTAVRTGREEFEEGDIDLPSIVREVTHQAVLGFQDAVDEVQRKKENGRLDEEEGNVLAALGQAGEKGGNLLIIAGMGIGVFAIVIIGLVIWAVRKTRSFREEIAARDDTLRLLARAIRATEGEPWSNELRVALRRAANDETDIDFLRRDEDTATSGEDEKKSGKRAETPPRSITAA